MIPPREAVRVRRATPADVDFIAQGNVAIARETEDLQLDPDRAHAGARAVIEDEGKGLYLVAERGGRIVGQLLLTREWSDWRAGWYVWIQSVHVARDARRSGVYRALHDAALAEARRENALAVRLYVERENHVAQATYAALGMRRARYDVFEVELSG